MNLKKLQAWVLGISIACFAFRNPIMQIGLIIGAVISLSIIIDAAFSKKLSFGSKQIYIPLLVVVFSIIISSIINYHGNTSLVIADCFMAVYLFVVYLTSRILGEEIFKPFAAIVVIETISIIVCNFVLRDAMRGGGLASFYNYNIAIGLLVFGSVVAIIKRQWIIVSVGALGVLLAGGAEGIFALGVMFITFLVRRDISKKLLVSVSLVLIVGVLGITPFSYTKNLYSYVIDKGYELVFHKHYGDISLYNNSKYALENNGIPDFLTNGRVSFVLHNIEWQKPFGRGYELLPNMNVPRERMPVHNVPLVVVQQIGILAGIAWLFLLVYCLVKTKWKYAFASMLVLGVFDNFMWAQIGIFVFTLIGVATVSERKSDLVFGRI